MRTTILAAVLTVLPAVAASAQEGLATTSTIGGHNTVQQAPSGGTAGRPIAGSSAAAGSNDQQTAAERQAEKHNDTVSTICKGC